MKGVLVPEGAGDGSVVGSPLGVGEAACVGGLQSNLPGDPPERTRQSPALSRSLSGG